MCVGRSVALLFAWLMICNIRFMEMLLLLLLLLLLVDVSWKYVNTQQQKTSNHVKTELKQSIDCCFNISVNSLTGQLDFVLQQQWLVRNAKVGSTTFYDDPVRSVSFVFVGGTTASCYDQQANNKPQLVLLVLLLL